MNPSREDIEELFCSILGEEPVSSIKIKDGDDELFAKKIEEAEEKIERVLLENCVLSNIQCLEAVYDTLEYIELKNTNIESISGIEQASSLHTLGITNSFIGSPEEYKKLKSIETLRSLAVFEDSIEDLPYMVGLNIDIFTTDRYDEIATQNILELSPKVVILITTKKPPGDFKQILKEHSIELEIIVKPNMDAMSSLMDSFNLEDCESGEEIDYDEFMELYGDKQYKTKICEDRIEYIYWVGKRKIISAQYADSDSEGEEDSPTISLAELANKYF